MLSIGYSIKTYILIKFIKKQFIILMIREDTLEILQHSDLFTGLPRKYIENIYNKGSSTVLQKKESIIIEGQKDHNICIVLKGIMEIILPKKGETIERLAKVELSVLGQGGYAGEYSLIDAKPASASVTACVESEIFMISRDKFNELLDGDDYFAKIIYANILKNIISKVRTYDKEADSYYLF